MHADELADSREMNILQDFKVALSYAKPTSRDIEIPEKSQVFEDDKCTADTDETSVPQAHSAVTPLELQKLLGSREPMLAFDRAAILQAYGAGLALSELRKINSSNVKACIDHRKKLEKEALDIGIPKAHLVGRTFQEIEKFIKRGYSTGPYVEKDHRGKRIDDTSKGIVTFLDALEHGYVLGMFDKIDDARAALLEVPCIQVAHDSGNLICLKRLTFGYYREETEGYGALVQGPDLDVDIWELAKAGFTTHGGHQLQWRMPPTPSESNDNIRTAYLAWMMAGKDSDAALPIFKTLRSRENSCRGLSEPSCMFHKVACTKRATWKDSKGHYFCDEHKEVMGVGFRLNKIDPGWERL